MKFLQALWLISLGVWVEGRMSDKLIWTVGVICAILSIVGLWDLVKWGVSWL